MVNPILKITDGVETVNLLELRGWTLSDWSPAVPEAKGGGVFRSSPLVDGRKLAYRKMDNVIDTFNLIGSKGSQDDMIASIRKLEQLLEKAISYWITGWQNEPVWIEAKAANETNMRYATIVDYRLTGFGGPYRQPFFASDCNSASEAILVIEHMIWQETIPSEDGNCVAINQKTNYLSSAVYNSDVFSPAASADDGFYGDAAYEVDLTSHIMHIGTYAPYGKCQTGIIFDNVSIAVDSVIKSATLEVIQDGTDSISIKVSGQSQDGGMINSVTLTNGGSGYYAPVAHVWGGGTGAEVAVTVSSGVITGISLVSGGRGYINPYIVIGDLASPPGTGATATCTVTTANADAASFDGTNSDFIERTRTVSNTIVSYGASESITTIDVTSIVIEIVGNANWDSGDSIGLFLESLSSSSYRGIYSYDEDTYDEPKLTIEWYESVVPQDSEKTCAAEVYISNKYSKAQINYMYAYDDSAVSKYSPNMIGWDYSSPMPLFQSDAGAVITPAAIDRIYIGSCYNGVPDTDYGPFSSAVFDLYSIAEDITGVWKYWNGGSWSAFDVSETAYNELCGDQIGLMRSGVGSIVFEQPTNWAATTVNGYYGFWITFEVTSIGGDPTSPYQWHRDISTVLTPYIDIDAEEVPGDIPALARIVFESAACAARSMNTLVLGLRSLSRGSNFCAYLNASQVQYPPNIKFSLESTTIGSHHLQASSSAPTGYILDLTTLDPSIHGVYTFLPICKWETSGNDYIGTYHAYVRCNFQVDIPGGETMRLRLKSVFGEEYNISYSDVGSVTLGGFICAVDLGQFTILPSFQMRNGETVQKITIYLETLASDDSIYTNSYVYDIILIPADEWSGNFGMPKITGTSVLEYGDGLEVDGITTPRQYRTVQTDLESSGRALTAEWSRISSSEPILQSNIDQRLWFFQYKHANGLVSYFEDCGAIRTERSARYLLMRGKS